MIIAKYPDLAINDDDDCNFSINQKYLDHHEKNIHRNGPISHYLRLPLIVFRLNMKIVSRAVSVQLMAHWILIKK